MLDKLASSFTHNLIITSDWKKADFARIIKLVNCYSSSIEVKPANLERIREYLLQKRSFLLQLLANQNLMEHESFTDLLWALFHLTDELQHRKVITDLSEADEQHLAGDINRVYLQLMSTWVAYMRHLQINYPYLFSLAMRTNPFDSNATVEIK